MPDSRDPQLDDLRRRARRRLVGAVVLALAAAVLVPMLLESDPKPLGEDVSVKIPPVDDGRFVNKVGERAKGSDAPATTAQPPVTKPETKPDLGSAAAPSPTSPGSAAGAAKDAPRTAEPAKEPPRSSEPARGVPKSDAARPERESGAESAKAPDAPGRASESAKPAASAPPPPAASAAAVPAEGAVKPSEPAKSGTYSVQLAAFIDDKGANSLAGRLKKSGYPAYTEPYSTSRGTLWRVRVGPYPSRDAAEAVRGRLKGEGQNGIITAAK